LLSGKKSLEKMIGEGVVYLAEGEAERRSREEEI